MTPFDAFEGTKSDVKILILYSRWSSLSKISTETKSWDNRTIRSWNFNVLKSSSLLGTLAAKKLGKHALIFASVLNIIQENPKIPSDALG